MLDAFACRFLTIHVCVTFAKTGLDDHTSGAEVRNAMLSTGVGHVVTRLEGFLDWVVW